MAMEEGRREDGMEEWVTDGCKSEGKSGLE